MAKAITEGEEVAKTRRAENGADQEKFDKENEVEDDAKVQRRMRERKRNPNAPRTPRGPRGDRPFNNDRRDNQETTLRLQNLKLRKKPKVFARIREQRNLNVRAEFISPLQIKFPPSRGGINAPKGQSFP